MNSEGLSFDFMCSQKPIRVKTIKIYTSPQLIHIRVVITNIDLWLELSYSNFLALMYADVLAIKSNMLDHIETHSEVPF